LLDALTETLLEKEKIEGNEFEALVQQYMPDIRPLPAASTPTKVEAAAPAEPLPASTQAEPSQSGTRTDAIDL